MWTLPRSPRRPGTCSIVTSLDVLLHDVRDLADAHALVADEVVGAALRLLGERGDDAVGEILDVHELARLAAVAVDLQRLAGERARDEARDDGRRARAAARAGCRSGGSSARCRTSSRTSGSTSRPRASSPCRSDRARRAATSSCSGSLARRVAVDPDGAAVDEGADPLLARCLEHHARAARVHEIGVHRVERDLVDVRDRREMDDRVAAAHRRTQRRRRRGCRPSRGRRGRTSRRGSSTRSKTRGS